MPPDFERACNAIKKYLKHHVPGLSVTRIGNTESFTVQDGSKQEVLQCSWEDLSDLEEALTRSTLPAQYRNDVVRDVMLRALVAVGKKGMAPEVKLSNLVINEELKWSRIASVDTSFDGETATKLYEGLKCLDALAVELNDSDVPVPDIEEEHNAMAPIIAYYEEKGHLNSPNASGESLAYLKAAALCWILDLEDKKTAITSLRVKAAKSVRLFEIVENFWLRPPFDRIALPPIVRDHVSHRPPATTNVAGLSGPSLDLGPQLKRLDPRLEERWRGAWQALRSENPDKVSQAANSMVEVLDKVIGSICGDRTLEDVLSERYPKQQKFILAQRATISALKSSLHSVKHETHAQSVHVAEDLMHAAEGIIRTLLRQPSLKA